MFCECEWVPREQEEEHDLGDVTLAGEENEQIEAHKVILSNSNPIFRNMFKRNKHNHPLIYMKIIKSKDQTSTVDYIYYVEVNIYQEGMTFNRISRTERSIWTYYI